MTFCKDQDLLVYEPNLPREAAFASQTKLRVTGSVAGTQLTIATGSLVTAGIEPGEIVMLDGVLAGCFPIVSVDSATTCTLTIVHKQLYDSPPVASPLGTASGLTCTFVSYYAQRRVVSELLARLASYHPEKGETILNPRAFKRSAEAGTMQMIYNALAAAGGDLAADLIVRSEIYERMYRKAVKSVRAEIDLNNDGECDTVRHLREVSLVRA